MQQNKHKWEKANNKTTNTNTKKTEESITINHVILQHHKTYLYYTHMKNAIF